jgi:hypothetical protein
VVVEGNGETQKQIDQRADNHRREDTNHDADLVLDGGHGHGTAENLAGHPPTPYYHLTYLGRLVVRTHNQCGGIRSIILGKENERMDESPKI